MKKAVLLSVLLFAVAAGAGCFAAKTFYKMNPPLAQYDGELKAEQLKAPVHVYRDRYAIPHVFAENEHDLYFAVGLVQAQDRLWEMVLLRAVAEGRTSELLGQLKVPDASFKGFPIDTLTIDRMQRTMGMKYVGEAAAELLKYKEPRLYNQLQAFADGINYYIETHQRMKDLPIEFQVLGVKPEPWRAGDAVSLGRLMGFILSYNMMFEVMRYGLIANYGEDIAWELAPMHDGLGPTVVPPEYLHNKLGNPRNLPKGGRPPVAEMGYTFDQLSGDAALQLAEAMDALRKRISPELPFASNNWVVSGKLTATGTPMLENDTHLFHVEPSIWYLIHVKCPGMDSFGVMVPGSPFHALGHTQKLSWGATTSIADVQDMFVEKTDAAHPGQYFHDGKWKDFTIRQDKFKVRLGGTFIEKKLDIRQTVHGPVLSDFLPLPEGAPPLSLRWTAWDFSRDQRVFDALASSTSTDDFMAKVKTLGDFELHTIVQSVDRLMRGESIEDFKWAMEHLDVPSQNWIAADSDGNIGYLPGGLLPLRKKGIGVLPAPGTGEFDWDGFLPIKDYPQMFNPERGWIVSANNEVVDMEWYPHLFSTNFDSGWRAWRAEELIQQLAPIDMADMKRIQNDIHMKKAEVEVPMILAAIERKKVTDPKVLKGKALLENWDYEATLESRATPVFMNYAEQMRRNCFADELGEKVWEKFLKESHADLVVEINMLKGQNAPIFDDVTTKDVVEDLDDMMIRSLHDSIVFLEDKYGEDPADWEWGKLHPIKFYHPLGVGPLADLSVGPWPQVGSRHTLRCASPGESGRWHFKDMNGPAWRHIIDMGDVEHAWGIIDGSISGQYMSPHYKDLVEVWVAGDHVTMTMDPEKVKSEARYHLVMEP